MLEKKKTIKDVRDHLLIQRKVDIAKERGIDMAEVLTHDILLSS